MCDVSSFTRCMFNGGLSILLSSANQFDFGTSMLAAGDSKVED